MSISTFSLTLMEVETVMAKECREKRGFLFPIRFDKTVMEIKNLVGRHSFATCATSAIFLDGKRLMLIESVESVTTRNKIWIVKPEE